MVQVQSEGAFHSDMQVMQRHSAARFWPLFFLLLVIACGGGDDFGSEHLIRVGDRVVTVFDFNQAFELTETAHSFGLQDHPEQYREAQERLLNQMTIELLMLTRADELNLVVSAQELDAKIADIKSDYPDDTFEETLLEAAVPFDLWKQRMKIRLLLEKLIATELQNQMTITPKDITDHYEKYFKPKPDDPPQTNASKNKTEDHEALIKDLRRRKAEESYDAWIEGLKARYPVEVNADVWEKLSAARPKPAETSETAPADKK